jgi:hypothetical protein
MLTSIIPVEQRIALYNNIKEAKTALKESTFALLGGRCSNCGATDNLRLRFQNHENPLAKRYVTNPMVLHRRLCREPALREEVHLLCRACRLNNPGHKPLETTKNEVGILERNN